MKNSPTSIQPSAAHRFFVKQAVQAIEIQRDEAVVRTNNGDVRVGLSTAKLVASKALAFSKLQLETNQGTFTLSGLPATAIQSIEHAIGEAARRASLVERMASEAGQVEALRRSWNAIASQKSYITATQVDKWKTDADLIATLSEDDADLLTKFPDGEQKKRRALDLLRVDPRRAADRRNTEYVNELLAEHEEFFNTVESYPLTDLQCAAIVHDEDNTLVIAGAGTGKTTTLVGKAGFILREAWAKPEEILMLVSTQRAADEMSARVRVRLGVNINVQAIETLSKEIVSRASGKQPDVCAEAEDLTIKTSMLCNIITVLMWQTDFRKKFLEFQSMLRRPYRPEWEFKSQAEYAKYIPAADLRALKGHFVRSYEECEIANWLFVNGIDYKYDQPYEIKIDSPEFRQYKPNFHIPSQGVYIEHWAVGQAEETPNYVNKAKYLEGMAWKRNIHKTNNTKLVETFSHERQEGVLLQKLEARLREYGITPQPITADATLATLNKAGRIEAFATVAGTFISQLKSAGRSIADAQARAASGGDLRRSTLFLELFAEIFPKYEAHIHQDSKVDLDDLITLAKDHVNSGRFQSPYCYILVDEFEGISRGSADLIIALRNQVKGCKVFATGDDWQSISRATGADISLITDMSATFGFTRTTALDTTFRFYDRIADFGSKFVQANPGQIRKVLTTPYSSDLPGITIWLSRADSSPLSDILDDINQINPSASVFVLGRYSDSLPDDANIISSRFRRMQIGFHSIHDVKGLEADYTIILGLDQTERGLPSKCADDPVLAMALPEMEAFEFAEERRLFYVALTRARKRVHIIADAAKPSAFLQEVLADKAYAKTVRGEAK